MDTFESEERSAGGTKTKLGPSKGRSIINVQDSLIENTQGKSNGGIQLEANITPPVEGEGTNQSKKAPLKVIRIEVMSGAQLSQKNDDDANTNASTVTQVSPRKTCLAM